ncbi:MAG: cupredoxin domain-containing protein [Candidatus Nitrosotenuis sp.]|uniref:cupredoxin domain-containing protein n=1 Tax=Candidatus Nitrosotenuis cloacae TaxID=1603555 RepID=UPI0022821979|nr:cupredoxin domain-containing protein [Candidatus Nitrosotenuis cloacae]MDC8437889.1 cupredoxin domain-containing protein [Candidatus Nitrosotenuis sp.]
MNTKLLASVAAILLLASIVSVSLMDSAYADEKTAKEKAKAKKAEVKQKTSAKKTEVKEKITAKKAESKEKKAEVKQKVTAKKTETKEKVDAKKSATASSPVVEMAKGTATNQDCGNDCFTPHTVNVPVGGTVAWKNVDTAAHTATAADMAFDTGMVMAGKTGKLKFETAGTFDYFCMVHPWMKGVIVVS